MAKTNTPTRLRANKAVTAKKAATVAKKASIPAKKTKNVALKDADIKELLKQIAEMQAKIDSLDSELKTSNINISVLESNLNDSNIELKNYKSQYEFIEKNLHIQQQLKETLTENVDQLNQELEVTKGLYVDATNRAKHNGELLSAKQHDLETTTFNYNKLHAMYLNTIEENTKLQKELKAIKGKWYAKILGI